MLDTHRHREAVGAVTALAAIAPVTWGTTYLVTTQWLPPDRPLLSGVLRALPAGLIALLLTRRLPRGVWWWRTAVLGTLNIGAFFVLLFVAAYRLPGGVAATLSAVQPLIVAGLALGLLGERPSRWRLGWGLMGVVGIAAMVLRGRLGFDPIGLVAGLAGTTVMATGTVLAKRWGRPPEVGALAFTAWQLTAGGLLIAPLALAVEGLPPRLDAPALAGYAWLSLIGTGLAYTLWFTGLARLPVTALSFLPLLSPVVAAVLGWLVLGQSLTTAQLVGFSLAMVSICAAQLNPNNEKGLTTMRITVFGAAGTTGSRIVAEALTRGHQVTAVVRDAARFAELPSAAIHRVGDATDVGSVVELSTGQDVVITTTRPAPGHEHELVVVAKAMLTALSGTGARLLAVGGAGSLTVPGSGGTLAVDDPAYVAPAWRPITLACNDQLAAFRADTSVDWTYLSPAAFLEPGERTGSYRLGTDELLVGPEGTSTISSEDFAVALLDEVERPRHSRTRFTVARTLPTDR